MEIQNWLWVSYVIIGLHLGCSLLFFVLQLTEVLGPICIKLDREGGRWMGIWSFASAPVVGRDSE